jgi:hypothetical protein
MLVRLANWLRWRKLANASPGTGWFTQGDRSCAKPRYCNTPSTLLITAASNQACATQCIKPLPSQATCKPTLTIKPMLTKAASKPKVRAWSTTAGTRHKALPTQQANPTISKRPALDMVGCNKGNSKTSKAKQATHIQLKSKGMTAVEGLAVNGLSHGKVMQAINKALRMNSGEAKAEDDMGLIFQHAYGHEKRRRGAC